MANGAAENPDLKRILARIAERVDIFNDLSPDELARLFANAERLSFTPGSTLMREGENGLHMYVIIEGNVLVTKQTQGGKGDIAIARLGAAESFGEMALIESRPRSATVVAASPCTVFQLSAYNVELTPEIGLKLYRNIARQLAARLRGADQVLAWQV